jgi:polysaccharide deacetylase family protein (PEP-CTERM system associated)
MLNVLSIDLEDYFHPTEVQQYAGSDEWVNLPSRVEHSTQIVLDLLESKGVKATFFVLGWVAEHHPALIRKIAAQGHEIGCHSYRHELVYALRPEEFEEDTRRAVKVIEDACGVTPRTYRAPSYSITARSMWALDVLASCGFTHDSSIYPISHDRYGIPGFGRHAQLLQTPSGSILEVPVATVQLSKTSVAPVGGGAYLRLFPYRYTAAGIRQINNVESQPACIYLHPWEFDPESPRLTSGFVSRVRTYTGLASVASKFARLLDEFEFGTLSAVHPPAAKIPAQSDHFTLQQTVSA